MVHALGHDLNKFYMKPSSIQREHLQDFVTVIDYLFKIYYRLPKLFFFFKPEHEVPDMGPLSKGLSDIQKRQLQYRKFREEQ